MKQMFVIFLSLLVSSSITYGANQDDRWKLKVTTSAANIRDFDQMNRTWYNNELTIFSESEGSLQLGSGASAETYLLKLPASFMALKSYSIDLAKMANVIDQALVRDTAYFLLAPNSAKALDEIASYAHSKNHLCGGIQMLPLGLIQQDVTTLTPPYYSPLIRLDEVSDLSAAVEENNIVSTASSLASLETRHHSSGDVAPDAVRALWQNATSGDTAWQITEFSHRNTTQGSLIASLSGTEDSAEVVVLGAHLDSINGLGPNIAAPGADDNASGIGVLTEVLRILSNSGSRFKRSISIQAYAAEEVGLIGSQEIATTYKDKTVAMMQVDMALYGSAQNNGKPFLIYDDTSVDTRRAAIHFMKQYGNHDFGLGSLPRGATSDHRAFFQLGIPTLFAFEDPSDYNTAIHTSSDTPALFNNSELAANIAKLALSFLSHYAGLEEAEGSFRSATESFRLPQLDDIYLSSTADTSNSHYLSVSAPENIHTVEVCELESPIDLSCSRERMLYQEYIVRGEKKIFYRRESAPIGNGIYRIWSYDTAHQLLSTRTLMIRE